jgi:hypothetical protein
MNLVTLATGNAVSFLWLQMKLDFLLHCKTVWPSGSKERLVEIRVLIHAADNNQSLSSTKICLHFLQQHKKTAICCDVAMRHKNKTTSELRMCGTNTACRVAALSQRVHFMVLNCCAT